MKPRSISLRVISALASTCVLFAPNAPAAADSPAGSRLYQPSGAARGVQFTDSSADSQPNPPVVTIRMWIVSFDPSVDRAKLPVDVEAMAMEERVRGGPVGRTGPDGRIQTTGLAVQEKLDKFAVTTGGNSLFMRDGALVSAPTHPNAKTPPPPWQILAAPTVVVNIGQQASISVGQSVAYLEPREGDCLVLKQSETAVEGASIQLTVERVLEKGIRFSNINLKLSRVTGREPIPGVPLDVGRPIIDSRETSLGLTADTGKVAIIPLPQSKEDPPILVFLTAEAAAQTP